MAISTIRLVDVTAKNKRALALMAKQLKEKSKNSLSKRIYSLIPLITEEIRRTISVPYVPGTRTPQGAPIRMRSGRAVRGVFVKRKGDLALEIGNTAKSLGTGRLRGIFNRLIGKKSRKGGFPYPAYHDVTQPGMPGSGKHPYVFRTLVRIKSQIRRILGGGSRRAVTHR